MIWMTFFFRISEPFLRPWLQEDPSSSRFWMTLGGRRFRLFERSPEAFLQAVPGRHWVVVRGRDRRGNLRAVRAAAPLRVEAESNFSISDATARELKAERAEA